MTLKRATKQQGCSHVKNRTKSAGAFHVSAFFSIACINTHNHAARALANK